MPSIVERTLTEREAFLRRYRRAYLRSIAAEMGMPNTDMRDIALREAVEFIEFAAGFPWRDAIEPEA